MASDEGLPRDFEVGGKKTLVRGGAGMIVVYDRCA